MLNFNTKEQGIYQEFVTSTKKPLSGETPDVSESEQKDIELKFNRLRNVIVSAGIRGIVALLRQFKFYES